MRDMYLVNFLDSVSSSDTVFYVLMVLLTLISVVLFYLIYSQNKEMSKQIKEKSLFDEEIPKKQEKTSSTIKEVESLEKPQIIPVTDMEIPNFLEMTQSINVISDAEELQSITKELETLPRERKIEMTPYEAEQEETAIISYDELVKQNDEKEEIVEEIKTPGVYKKPGVVFEPVTISDTEEVINSYATTDNSKKEEKRTKTYG